MYDHPIKRAGLTFNRILLSNTKMVLPCFPGDNVQKFKITYKLKLFENGKELSRRYVNDKNMDDLFPARK
jgi:hypothetical protein